MSRDLSVSTVEKRDKISFLFFLVNAINVIIMPLYFMHGLSICQCSISIHSSILQSQMRHQLHCYIGGYTVRIYIRVNKKLIHKDNGARKQTLH